ncbi:MAG: acyl carrier protein [Gemmatimonadota bacterium]
MSDREHVSPEAGALESTVKSYILEELLPGEDPGALDDSTPLIMGGILDSLSTVKLALFLEERYGVEFAPHEMSADNLDSIGKIADLVRSKLAER